MAFTSSPALLPTDLGFTASVANESEVSAAPKKKSAKKQKPSAKASAKAPKVAKKGDKKKPVKKGKKKVVPKTRVLPWK